MLPTIDIHTHHPRPGQLSLPNVRIRDEHPAFPASGPYSAGIHPWDTAEAHEAWLDTFVSPPAGLAAIGETGLDLRPPYPPLEVQRPWLEAQLQVARRLDLPVILHNVRATAPLQAILSRHSDLTLLLHGFTGSPELVRQWIRQVPAVRFSFGPALMRSPKSQDALRWIATQCPEPTSGKCISLHPRRSVGRPTGSANACTTISTPFFPASAHDCRNPPLV